MTSTEEMLSELLNKHGRIVITREFRSPNDNWNITRISARNYFHCEMASLPDEPQWIVARKLADAIHKLYVAAPKPGGQIE